MKIIVQGKSVETKEIFDIQEIEHNKTMFLNREAGFIIYLVDKEPLVFKEDIPYESYPREIANKKSNWDRLMNEIISKWESDKSELETFKL